MAIDQEKLSAAFDILNDSVRCANGLLETCQTQTRQHILAVLGLALSVTKGTATKTDIELTKGRATSIPQAESVTRNTIRNLCFRVAAAMESLNTSGVPQEMIKEGRWRSLMEKSARKKSYHFRI